MQYVKIYFASRVPLLRELPVNQRVVKLEVRDRMLNNIVQ